jgi:hypothetical protein
MYMPVNAANVKQGTSRRFNVPANLRHGSGNFIGKKAGFIIT